MLNIEKPRLAFISNSPTITQISLFHLESYYSARVFNYPSVHEFKKNFRNHFDFIIYDQHNNQIPNEIDPKITIELEEPYQYSNFSNIVSKKLKSKEVSGYLPIRLEFLQLIEKIKVPLFLEINDSKFIKVEHENSHFDNEKFNRYKMKGLGTLHILAGDVEKLVRDFIKKSLSDSGWEAADELKNHITVNIETMKTFTDKMGWTPELLNLAELNIKKALALAKKTKNLESAFRQFLKIEKFGFADRCLLMTLITTKLVELLLQSDPDALRRQTFACLFHDITLNETMLNNQNKLLEQMKNLSLHSNKQLQEFFSHPSTAANICFNWDFCPIEADQIILNHHEKPDGSGFPYGKFDLEMSLDSIIFNIALDFSNRYIDSIGEYTPQQYYKEKKEFQESESFHKVLKAFASIE